MSEKILIADDEKKICELLFDFFSAGRSADTSHNTQKDRLSVDRKAYIATLDGKPLELTLKEFELLSYLLENSGQVISRDRRRIRHLQHRPQKLAYKIPQVGACGILC